MVISIVANSASTYAQQALSQRNESVAISTRRLSSGQRVFSADQDAAALAVGASLKIENAALATARINAAGAVSALQITDGALGQIGDVLNRLQVLAVQAGSANISDGERSIIGLEFNSLRNEVQRISQSTEFNGIFPLKGNSAFTLQGAHNYAGLGISNLTVGDGSVVADAAFRYAYDSTTEQLTVTRTDAGVASSQTIDITLLLNSTAGAGNNLAAGQNLPLVFSGVGVTLELGPNFNRSASILPTITDASGPSINFTPSVAPPAFVPATTGVGLPAVQGLQALPNTFYNQTTGQLTLPLNSDGTAVTLSGLPGVRYAVNGGVVGVSGAGSTNLVGAATTLDIYTDTTSGPALLGRVNLVNVTTSGTTAGSLDVPVGQGLIGADYTGTNANTNLTYMVGSGVIAGQDLVQVSIPAMNITALGLALTQVDTLAGASSAITAVKDAQNILYQARAEVGAQQSRLEVVGRSLSISIENNEGSRSALLDADASQEIINLTNDQAMLEVGISMLSQANKVPQLLVELLRQG